MLHFVENYFFTSKTKLRVFRVINNSLRWVLDNFMLLVDDDEKFDNILENAHPLNRQEIK